MMLTTWDAAPVIASDRRMSAINIIVFGPSVGWFDFCLKTVLLKSFENNQQKRMFNSANICWNSQYI